MIFRQQVDLWVAGKEVTGSVAVELRLFAMCEAMKWNHLPAEGGLGMQHPVLLERFRHIFSTRAQYEREEQERRDRDMKNKTRANSPRVAGRRR